jgi:hypothetical protein
MLFLIVTGYDKNTLPVRIYAEMSEASADAVCQMDVELCAIVAALRLVYVLCCLSLNTWRYCND